MGSQEVSYKALKGTTAEAGRQEGTKMLGARPGGAVGPGSRSRVGRRQEGRRSGGQGGYSTKHHKGTTAEAGRREGTQM